MKRWSVFIALVFTTCSVIGQNSQLPQNAVLNVSEKNFGNIRQGKPVTEVFYLINKGKESIKIQNVFAECGCTTPKWSESPIAPGDSLSIEIGYNAAAEGPFRRKIEIIVEHQPQPIPVFLSGNVYPAQATSAPLNSSLVKDSLFNNL